MCEMLKRSHLFFIAAVLLVTLIFITSYAHAGSVLAEIPYASSHSYYSHHRGKVVLKWSKAYARLENGTVSDVSGYEIQYSKYSSFYKAKSVFVGRKTRKHTVTLKALRTKKKYRRNIKKYHFRVRSYVKVNGNKVYSRWCDASGAVDMVIYSPAEMTSLTAEKNTVTPAWKKVKGKGYVIFNMVPGATVWKKRNKIGGQDRLSYKDKSLEYSTTYKYAIVSYRKKRTSDPAKYSSSYLKAIDKAKNSMKATTAAYKMSKPTVRAVINGTVLKVIFSAVDYADKYTIQYSNSEDFSNAVTITVKEGDLNFAGAASFMYEIGDIESDNNYYVRVRASGKYNKVACQSAYSAKALAKAGTGVYQIVFDGNSATSGKMDPITVSTGQEVVLPANTFKRTGYKFDGWCFKENNVLFLDSVLPMEQGFPDYYDKDPVQDLTGPDQTITLYACWQAAGPQAAADWAVTIAGDDDFYYGNKVVNHCWFCQGGAKTYICNALVASSYTHGMRYFTKWRSGSTDYRWWLKNGFSKVGKNVSLSKIKKGDVICCWNGKRWCHIMMAVTNASGGDAVIVHASGKGTGPSTIREDSLKSRVKKYKAYYVVRLKSWKPYQDSWSL